MFVRCFPALAFAAVLSPTPNQGIITTVIGTGVAGASGDGGPGKNAQLNTPNGVAVDATGNVYIADYANSRIRKLLTTDFTQTIAGCSRHLHARARITPLALSVSQTPGTATLRA